MRVAANDVQLSSRPPGSFSFQPTAASRRRLNAVLDLMELPSLIANALVKAVNLWTKPVFGFGIRDGRAYAELMPKVSLYETVDARLAKIELARKNLTDALEAIDELKSASEANQRELAIALERLHDAKEKKTSVEKELQAVQSIAQADIGVFRKLAGVPSKTEIAKERLVGFFLGVLASIVATVIWWSVIKHWPSLR